MQEGDATDQTIFKLRLAGFRLEEIARLLVPPISRQRVWERLHRDDPKRLERRRRQSKARKGRAKV